MDFGMIQGAQPLRQPMMMIGIVPMGAPMMQGGGFGFGMDGFHGSPDMALSQRGGQMPFLGSMFGGGAGSMLPQMGFGQPTNPLQGLLQMAYQMNPMLGMMMEQLLQGFMGFGNPLCMGMGGPGGMGGMGGGFPMGGMGGGFPMGGMGGGFPMGGMGGGFPMAGAGFPGGGAFAGVGPNGPFAGAGVPGAGALAGIGPNGPFAGGFGGAPQYQMPPAAFAPPPAYQQGGRDNAGPIQTNPQPQQADRNTLINTMLARGGKGITDQQRQLLMKDLQGIPDNVLAAINKNGTSLQVMQHGETPDDYNNADGQGLVTVGEYNKDTNAIKLSADWLGKEGLGKTSITKHEFGHAYQDAVEELDPTRAKGLDATNDAAFRADKQNNQLPTEYATTNREYFAETFSKGLDGKGVNGNQGNVLNQFLNEANRI